MHTQNNFQSEEFCLAGTSHIDAIGIAPYFDGYDIALPDLPSLEASYARAVNSTLAQVRQHHATASAAGYKLVTYEGGILAPSQQSSGLCSPASGGWGPVSHAASLSNYSLSNLSGSETRVVFGVQT